MANETKHNHQPNDLAGTWHLDAEPAEEVGEVSIPETETAGPTASARPMVQPRTEVPPSPEQIIEAMLFIGGHPLDAQTACSAVRGLTPDRFHAAIDALTRRYRIQQRPYTIQTREEGFVLTILPVYRGLREKLFGGPREARLGQHALDVLAVVAYRQPVGKLEVDAVRGTDSSSILRHLVRLGLVAVQHRAEAGTRSVRYGTTSRFLQVFGLASLDELPRLGDTSQM
jgi:segregation and condensation protein B